MEEVIEVAEVAALLVLHLVEEGGAEEVAAVALQIDRPVGETMLRMMSNTSRDVGGIDMEEVTVGGEEVEAEDEEVGALTIPLIRKRERKRTISQTSQTRAPSALPARVLRQSLGALLSHVKQTQTLFSNGKPVRSNAPQRRHEKRERKMRKRLKRNGRRL